MVDIYTPLDQTGNYYANRMLFNSKEQSIEYRKDMVPFGVIDRTKIPTYSSDRIRTMLHRFDYIINKWGEPNVLPGFIAIYWDMQDQLSIDRRCFVQLSGEYGHLQYLSQRSTIYVADVTTV